MVLFNKILDSFAEGNEFLQKYVVCLKSIELNKQKISELEKGGRTPLRNSEWRWPVESGEKRKKEK